MEVKEHVKNPFSEDGEREVDVKHLVSVFFSNWHWFALSALLLLAMGVLFLKTQPNIYLSKASVLIKQDENAPEEMLLLQDMGFSLGAKNNIDNEIGVVMSPDLITRIVSSLELYTTYRRESHLGFQTPELYKNAPLYVRLEDVDPELIPGLIVLIFTPEQGGYHIKGDFNKGEQVFEKSIAASDIPGYVELPIGRFYIANQPGIKFGSHPLMVTIDNASRVARKYIENLDVATTTKNSSLFEIALRVESKKRGEDFVQALINEYNRDAVKDKNTVAHNTSVFIEERLKDIARELGEVERRVETFRKKHEVADITTQVGSYIRQSENYEARKMEIETQLNLVRFIENFLTNADNKNKLVPNLGLKDPGLVMLINEFNALLIDRERIESSTSSENPALKMVNQKVDNMHANIVASIANERQASEIALANLESEHTITNSKINNFPTVDREYTDILRQQEVKSNLFVYLLQKREEVNLTQAAVAPKAKMIARPHSDAKPVAPKSTIILLGFFLVGFSLPGLILFLRNFFQTRIQGIQELEKLRNVKVVGDIIKSDSMNGKSELLVKPQDNSVISEMFRTLRNNLLFMLSGRDQKVVLVTSTVPKEGKTFICSNLARSLSLMDKKVLLIGADLRNPQIAQTLGLKLNGRGLSSYLAGQVDDLTTLIEEVHPNFYAIQAGPVPPNPNELLSNEQVGEVLNQLRETYDYILIDSAPVGVVSDTFLMSPFVDATMYVVREGFSEKDTISFINNITLDKRLKNVGVVLNSASIQKNNGKYRYGHGYGYGYGIEGK